MTKTAAAKTSTTRTVTANTLWYGLDISLGVLMVFLTSIPLARALGPEQLGYFNYVAWLCGISGSLGNMGLPGATCKFMALYLSGGQGAMARAVFRYTLRMQMILASAITGGGMLLVLFFGNPAHRTVSLLQVATILPTMLSLIPTWANMSNEKMSRNIPGGIISDVTYLVFVWLSLALRWNLVGVAAGMLLAKIVEFVIRLRAAQQWIGEHPKGHLSPEAKKPLFHFAGQQLYMSLIGALLWNKSDVVLLKWLSSDIRQVTFFTLAYNIIDKVAMLPQVIAGSISISVVAQTGHDHGRAAKMTATATRYIFLLSAPLLFGVFLIAGPVVRVLYGYQFQPTAPILGMAALFAIVKPLVNAPDALFRATGRQARMLVCATAGTILNLGLDYLLIPRYGATGAAIGNGIGQAAVVISYYAVAVAWFDLKLDYRSLALIVAAAGAMAPAALVLNAALPAKAALVADVVAGAAMYLTALRLSGVLESSDVKRVREMMKMLPLRLQPAASSAVRVVFGRLATC